MTIVRGSSKKKHPYKCSTCQRRKSLLVGTGNDTVRCKHHKDKGCNGYYRLDKCRLYNDEKSRGERCDCNGPKAQKMDKYYDPSGGTDPDAPVTILGPHRKGQFGCKYHVPKDDFDDVPFGDDDSSSDASANEPCPF